MSVILFFWTTRLASLWLKLLLSWLVISSLKPWCSVVYVLLAFSLSFINVCPLTRREVSSDRVLPTPVRYYRVVVMFRPQSVIDSGHKQARGRAWQHQIHHSGAETSVDVFPRLTQHLNTTTESCLCHFTVVFCVKMLAVFDVSAHKGSGGTARAGTLGSGKHSDPWAFGTLV